MPLAQADAARTDAARPTILVVAQSPGFRDVVAHLLEAEGLSYDYC